MRALIRGALLALLVMVAACASTADAGVQDASGGRCECDMSAINRAIPYTLLGGINPNGSNIHEGDVFFPVAGGPSLWMVYNFDGAARGIFNLVRSVTIAATFTPSTSGDGTISITIGDTSTGLPIDSAIVDVDIISAGNVTSVGIAGGAGVLDSVLISTTSARVRGETNSAGVLNLLFNGTASQAYRFVVTSPQVSPVFGTAAGTRVTLTGTLPA